MIQSSNIIVRIYCLWIWHVIDLKISRSSLNLIKTSKPFIQLIRLIILIRIHHLLPLLAFSRMWRLKRRWFSFPFCLYYASFQACMKMEFCFIKHQTMQDAYHNFSFPCFTAEFTLPLPLIFGFWSREFISFSLKTLPQ